MLNRFLQSPLLALILAPIVTYLGNRGQELITAYDRLPPIGKQAVAMALSFVFVAIAHAFPGLVPEPCVNVAATGLSSACVDALLSKHFLTALITGLLAIAIKHGNQNVKK